MSVCVIRVEHYGLLSKIEIYILVRTQEYNYVNLAYCDLFLEETARVIYIIIHLYHGYIHIKLLH